MSKTLVIAIPTRGQIHSYLVQQLADIRTASIEKGVSYQLITSRAMPVSANRNSIVKMFLAAEHKPEYLLMIDDDIVPPSNILDMLDHNVDVVSANCRVPNLNIKEGVPTFSTRSAACIDTGTEKGFLTLDETFETGLHEVHVVGTGCLLIHRRVLEKMDELGMSWFNFRYDKYDNITLSEDYDFCLKARELGFKIWFDGDMRCAHFKTLPI